MIDSGVGGISVLAHVQYLLPDENLVYFADIANAPYGEKRPEEIVALLHQIIKAYPEKDLKSIVLACNTATSAAASILRSELTIPVIGMEPALKPAVMETDGRIIVMATRLTIREEKFRKLLEKYGQGKDIVPLSCPGLMVLVEKDPSGPEVRDYLKEILAPYEDTAESVVLGCTHYVFLYPLIRTLYPKIRIFDGNEGVARHLAHVLEENQALGGNGEIEIRCSVQEPEERDRYLQRCGEMYTLGQNIIHIKTDKV